MKKLLLASSLLVMLLFSACQETYELGETVTEDQITWSYHETEVSNVYAFEHTTEGVITVWDFGNGETSQSAIDTATFAMEGTYTVTLIVLSNGGETKITEDIYIPETNYSFMEGEFYDNLVGDKNDPVGKQWVVDRHYEGHLTMGENLDNIGNWWVSPGNTKDGLGLYDDTLVFSITDAGLEYKIITNGTVYANSAYADELGSTDGNQEPDGNDFIMPVSDVSDIWFINGDENEITFGDAGFMGYFTGYGVTYHITLLEENVLEVVCADPSGIAWGQRFVTVDNLTSGEVVIPEQVSIMDLTDNFNGSSLDWELTGDNSLLDIQFTTVDGRSVGAFTRGNDDLFAEMHTDLDGVIDFSLGANIRIDVYVPESNDYSAGTIGEWWSFPTEEDGCKTLEVKLHNTAQGGNSWASQLSLKTDVLKDYEGQWVTLVFDFDDVYAAAVDNTDRDLMDRVILQFGGEGWSYNPGISVYYDNIIGLETSNDQIITKSTSAYPVVVIK